LIMGSHRGKGGPKLPWGRKKHIFFPGQAWPVMQKSKKGQNTDEVRGKKRKMPAKAKERN